MAINTDQTINATALPSITRFLEAQVNIISPANNAKLGTTFTVTDGASCEAFRDDGAEVISDRAKDKETATANATSQPRGVVVAAPFQPKDPEAVFSAAAYLDDLLDFATRRVKTAATGGALISR